MFASIEGIVEEKSLDRVIINVHGLGYEVYVASDSLVQLEKGKNAKLFIREQIKEDSFDLFGFSSLACKELFEKLLSVKNVGPRVAMAVLNIGSVDSVKQAIAGGDTRLLQTAKGVGRRAAEQIVVELRDKVGLSSSAQAEAIVGRGGDSVNDEATEALISLGYSPQDARMALVNIDPSLSVEERVTQALKGARR